MGSFIDLSGGVFGRFTVVRKAEVRKRKIYWECACSCGAICIVAGGDLRSGHTQSCGCQKIDKAKARAFDMSGRRFGKLVATSRAPAVSGHTYWNCVCDCGSQVTKEAGHLRDGHTRSCGCLKVEYGESKTTHGHSVHGSTSPEYRSWTHMLDRCTRESAAEYASYGGRGISVCPQWYRFESFLADVGPRPSLVHSIDRINNDGNYEPGNVRWATRTEQARNRRSGVWIEHNGERLVVAEWAVRLQIDPKIIYKRVRRGITDPERLFAPRTTIKNTQENKEHDNA